MFRLSTIYGSGKTGRIVIILLTVVLLTLLGFVHFKWWPWQMMMVHSALSEGRNWCNFRIDFTIRDGMYSIWYPNASALLAAEESRQDTPINRTSLERLDGLPGVLDAFYLNFADDKGFSVNGIIPNDDLTLKLDVFGKKGAGGAAQLGRRLVGGLTRFKRIKTDKGEFPVMVRYVGTNYPNYATEAIGLVLDEGWFIHQIPSILDSLAHNSFNLLFFAPAPPDTQWGEDDDPYACPGGAWKQTMGVLHGKDTLWWFGDRNLDMEYTFDKGFKWGYVGGEEAFNIMIKIKTEFPVWDDKIKAGKKDVKTVFTLLEFFGILLIISLIVSTYYAGKQAKRNNIALAHLAHSIKTPVSRIRLDADSLLEEMVASPAEEREIISAINRECERMERAVQSAALSLEEGRRTLNLETCDLDQIVSKTTLAWQTHFDQADIKLKIETTDETLSGRFDAEMIAILIDNLLDNALRHTGLNMENISNDAIVSVRVRKIDSKAEIIIDDMGGGIPAADRKHIFRRFGRVKGDAASGVSGLGLGLALVKEIAEAHGGKIHVTDNDLGGARFVVDLPISS